MMGNMVRKWLCMCLVAAMLCSGCLAGAAGQGGPWYDAAVRSAEQNGLLIGDADGLSPEKDLTRAQLATILVRAFSAKDESDLSAFSDVRQDAWYYHAMAKAVQMGIFEGNGGRLYPDAPVTREETFKVLAACFQLSGQGDDLLSDYQDSDQVSGWARQPANAMIAAGYVQGTDGAIAPKEPITRAEFAQVMYRMVQGYCSAEGTYTELPAGNVVINTADVSLKDTVIQGDLILADGLGLADIDLSGVTVTGRVLIRGGGLAASGGTTLPLVQIASPRGETRISTENGARVEKVQADSPVVIAGNAGVVKAQSRVTVEKGAAVESLVLAGTAVQAEISGSVELLSTTETASNTTIEVRQGGEVGHAVVQADGVTVAGSGTVKQVTANADDVHVETGNTKVVATENAGSVSVGKETISSGDQVTSNGDGSGVKPEKSDSGKHSSHPSVIQVTGITVTPESVTLEVGGSAALTAAVQPENATEKKVAWTTDNAAVASVDETGRVIAVSPGTAAITAVTADGGFAARCMVTVNGPKTWYAGGTDASDENSGTQPGQAFATVQAAIDRAADGDTIVICGGVSLGQQGKLTEISKGLTFTSKTATEDYTQTGVFAWEDDLSFGGQTVFRDIHIDIVRTLDVFANGNPILFDDGVETHDRSAGYIADRSLYLYGGGCNTDCDETSITIRSGRIHYVFGGGKATEAGASAQVFGDTSVVITGGYVDDSIVGGGETYASDTNVDVLGSSSIQISGSDFAMGWYDNSNTIDCGTIYGGGWAFNRNSSAQVVGGTNIDLLDTEELFAQIVGGGCTGADRSDATVGAVSLSLANADLGDLDVYGGGLVYNSGSPIVVDGDTSIRMTDSAAGTISGGCISLSSRTAYSRGDVLLDLSDCTVRTALVGGGCAQDPRGTAYIEGNVTMRLNDVTVPRLMCAGWDVENGGGDVSVQACNIKINGALTTETGSIDGENCKNGCTVLLEEGAAPSFADFTNWYYADKITNISDFTSLKGVLFTWEDSKWICDKQA